MTKRKSTENAGVRSSARTTRGQTTATPAAAVTAEPSRATPAAEPAPARGPTKQAVIIGLLQRPEGASLADLMAATGWLAHTTRAALSRLRQAGHVIDKSKGESGAVYRIAKPGRTGPARKAA